jgi:hypothetical protein
VGDIPSWLSLMAPKLDDLLKNSQSWVDSLRNLLYLLLFLNAAMLFVLIYIAWRLP